MATGALHQLREAIKRNDEITLDETSLVLGGDGGVSLERKQATNFHSLRGRGAPLELDAVYLQWKLRDVPYPKYVKECEQAGVTRVPLVDKNDLVSYLNGEIATCNGLVVEGEAPEAVGAPEPKKQKVDGGSVRTSARRQPREQRSLDSTLLVEDWDFSTIREKLAKSLAKARKNKPSTLVAKKVDANDPSAAAAASFDPRGDRYTNNQDRFWRENMGAEFQEFGINPKGSFFKPKAAAEDTNRSASKSAPPLEAAPSRSAARPRSSSNKLKAPPDPSELRPIVIVPMQGSALISAGNMRQFLEDGHFIRNEELRARGEVPDLSAQVKVKRTPGGNCSSAEYLLVNNAARLRDEEWDRVVAVVCSGKKHQFKHWKWAGDNKGKPDIVQCLHKVQGFFFHYDDEKPDEIAASWKVKLIGVSRSKRYTDAYAQRQFFEAIDGFIRSHAKRVRY